MTKGARPVVNLWVGIMLAWSGVTLTLLLAAFTLFAVKLLLSIGAEVWTWFAG